MWGESNITISYEVLLELMSKLSGLQKALFSLPINLVEYNLAAHDDQTFQLLFTPFLDFLLFLTDWQELSISQVKVSSQLNICETLNWMCEPSFMISH